MLPHSLRDIQNMTQDRREMEVARAMELAVQNGAKKVALAGQLASQLHYCKTFSNETLLTHRDKITTGHAVTCLAVAVTFESILKHTTCKTLAVVGVGSIGQSSLTLLLEKVFKSPSLKMPSEIILCDLKSKAPKIKAFAKTLRDKYRAEVRIVFYGDSSFEQVYTADMFLGASSTPSILETQKLPPGAILIDDSFPPVINVKEAIQRMKSKENIIIAGGGKLVLSATRLKSLSWKIPRFFLWGLLWQLGREGVPGCWLEAILFAHYDEEVTRGPISPKQILSLWRLKNLLELKAPPLHFYKHTLSREDTEKVYAFRRCKK